MEFHITRSLREKLDLNEILYSYTGNVVFANVAAARRLAAGLNALRGASTEETATINGGALFAMGLIDELNHAMVEQYRKEIDPTVLTEAVRWFESYLGKPEVDRLLLEFVGRFPGSAVYRGEITAAAWLARSTDGLPHRESEVEELLMLWLANQNPAFAQFRELFADDELKLQTAYTGFATGLPVYFDTRPPISPAVGSLIDALKAPMLASPDSIVGQLEFIRGEWAPYLGADLKRALLAIDVVREEDVAIWMRFHPPTGSMPQHGEPGWEAHGFAGDEYIGYEQDFVVGPDGVRRARQYATDHQAPLVEYEAFSPDQAWMPNVVMMAKSTYVWLEQLSKKYLRHIHRLDQIPDEELETLAGRGMTALWLIGLWERSTASRTIKRLRGQADAVASAYSLKEYNIAADLGGNEGYERLRDRAARFGLRLASDMVPNHMGIDSPWVIEHPEWFITRNDSPFPVYRFDGPDLSNDSRAEIKIEDHYYDMTDAAVAFRLRTYNNNQTHFMYHGNDGTTFAWNDTAQLDYSKAFVREHIMQTILHVARLFPIIRFDAAMVLAKRHVQRLWFPLPGVGGSIPSRAENAMSQEEFDALMPNEFWREVVDRVAVEVPGTLLLAEAFWLLEGYFVRTLGMHRVYNSAFMNMLRDEENAKYRSYLKKTLEFDPDILKRYVNFMSNPDEKTAAEQFGSGDKHFGTCTLLATLPGLPMFAHGQVEGFSERYGMDFKEAKLQEVPDEGLIARYYREITPLLKNRALFAESENFVLYDFWTGHGAVDENVMAYSNRLGHERAIILYNNIYGSTRGTILTSVAGMDKGSGELRQRSLIDALALSGDHDSFVAYRDVNSGIEFLRRGSELRERGLTVDLHGYQYIVLQQWRELRSTAEWPWEGLHDALQGAGVPNLDDALTNHRLKPVRDALWHLLRAENVALHEQAAKPAAPTAEPAPKSAPEPAAEPAAEPAEQEEQVIPAAPTTTPVLAETDPPPAEPEPEEQLPETFSPNPLALAGQAFYSVVQNFYPALSAEPAKLYGDTVAATAELITQAAAANGVEITPQHGAQLLAWIAFESLPAKVNALELFDQLRIRQSLAEILGSFGLYGEDSWRAAARIRLPLLYTAPVQQTLLSNDFWSDGEALWLLGESQSEGIRYFSKEKFTELIAWLELCDLARPGVEEAASSQLTHWTQSAKAANYRIDTFRQLLKTPPLELQTDVQAQTAVPA